MRNTILTLLATAGILLGPVGLEAQTDGAEAEAEARAIAGPWLQALDAGDYRESWDQASSAFQEGVPAEAWAERMRMTRAEIGPLVGRTFSQARYSSEVPNAPPGEYVFVEYFSQFQNAPPTVESVVLRKEGEHAWKVAAMSIRPMQ